MFAVALFAAVVTGSLVGWLGVAFFGLGLATFLVDRIRPTTLTIRPDSVEMTGPLGGRKSFRYSNCGPFGVFEKTVAMGQRVDWLTFDYDGKEPRSWLQRANLKTTGSNSQLRVDGYGRSPDAIAYLLNSYRDAALPRPKRD